MEKSIDTLRAEMWRDRYTAILNQYRTLAERERIMREEYGAMAQDLDDFYQERCDLNEALLQEKSECARLHQCLRELVDAGIKFLASLHSMEENDGSREAQFREAIETGRKEINGTDCDI